jgi:hypothetical protein
LIWSNVGLSLPERIPEAIVETLLEVCFGVLFLPVDAVEPLFDPALFALALFVIDGFAVALFVAAGRVPLLFADAGLGVLFGAAARPAPLLLLDDAGFALLLFPPREPALPPPVFTAISFAPAVYQMPSIDAPTSPAGLALASIREPRKCPRSADKYAAPRREKGLVRRPFRASKPAVRRQSSASLQYGRAAGRSRHTAP